MKYTIRAVNPDVQEFEWEGKKMKTYKVIFEEMYDAGLSDFEQTAVAITSLSDKPAPQKGEELQGKVDMSAKYGPKFVKDRTGGSYGGGGGRTQSDPKTFYVSYAKDIMVAQIQSGKYKDSEFETLLDRIAAGGKQLMDAVNNPTVVDKDVEDAKKLFDK